MATLHTSVHPFPELKFGPGTDYKTVFAEQDKALKELEAKSEAVAAAIVKNPKASLVGYLASFGVADGAAFYVVVKDKPLTLAHVGYGDSYAIPLAHVRGITRADLVNEILRAHSFKSKLKGK